MRKTREACAARDALSRRITRWSAALILAFGGSASAHDQNFGFVLANQPTSPQYTATQSTNKAFNDSGGDINITRSDTGDYAVHLAGLYDPSVPEGKLGNFQVTAFSTAGEYCKISDLWTANQVDVQCYDTAGAPADVAFSLLYHLADQHPNQNVAYALAAEATTPTYTPPADYVFNPSVGDPTSVSRFSPGFYRITWNNLDSIGNDGGHVQVTAVGSDSSRCQLQGWTSTSADVRCYADTGAPADSMFSVYNARPNIGDPTIAFAWADSPTGTNYSPASFYAYNPASGGAGGLQADRFGVGRYRMEWLGLGTLGTTSANVQVTAYGNDDIRCAANFWGSSFATVECRDSAGNLADTRYNIMYLDPVQEHWSEEFATATIIDTSFSPASVSASRSFNPTGGPISVNETSTGEYEVNFEGFAQAYPAGGNVQVTTLSPTGANCNVEGWSTSTGIVVVQCYSDSGSPTANTNFQIFYLKGSNATPTAYAWAGNPTAAVYNPNLSYANNPSGGEILIERSEVGTYRVSFADFTGGTTIGHAQVTSYGPGNNVSCSARLLGGIPVAVDVTCRDTIGGLIDSRFSLMVMRPENNQDALAFMKVGLGSPLNAPSVSSEFNSADGDVFIDRISTGFYQVDFERFDERGRRGDIDLLTVDGNTATRCTVQASDLDSTFVRCTDRLGTPTDARFQLAKIKPTSVPEPGMMVGIAFGGLALALMRRRGRSE
ncbi:MAG: PEP-CTERM sorting domain-containing protein [Myxococcota bacterium]